GRTEHDPRRPGVHRGANRLRRAQTSADLHRYVDLGGDPPYVLQVGRLPGSRPVQVDDVECPRSGCHPAHGGIERILVIDGLLVELPPGQTYRLAIED